MLFQVYQLVILPLLGEAFAQECQKSTMEKAPRSSEKASSSSATPIIPEEERAEIIAAMENVDYVILFDQEDPLEVIATIKPDVLVKGGDWSIDTIVGRDVVESYGGTVVALPMIPGVSTSRIIEDIVAHASHK